MKRSKLIGGILLIVGTSIGGGMLALPVAMASAGIGASILFLLLCWLVMTTAALLILEVNLRLPAGSNLVSMAKMTLGLPGQIIAWVVYLFLLYTLLAVYISGGTDVFNGLLSQIHIHPPFWLLACSFTALFSAVIYNGIRTVDYVNRGLMFGKLGVYLLLVFIISPHIQLPYLKGGSLAQISGSIMIAMASFGFASLVPSLREYFEDNVPALRQAIVWGSLIPLLCYILWIIIIMGVVAKEGDHGLFSLAHSDHVTSGLTESLSLTLHNRVINGFFSFFTSICMITAFLGVSMGLFDFLADGLHLKKSGQQGYLILILTFVPSLLVVLISPGIYLKALSYAGILCVILLLLLPILMAWEARKLHVSMNHWQIPGGRWLLIVLAGLSILLLTIAWRGIA